jgi:hypothetical protein
MPAPQTPQPAAGAVLVYTNPPAVGYRLEADPGSNGSAHLRLNLVGPAGTRARGVALFVTVDDSRATWAAPMAGAPGLIQNLGVWDPGADPAPMVAKTANGTLQAGLFQKDGTPVLLGAAPLAQFALDLNPAAAPGPVPLAVPAGKRSVCLDDHGQLQPITLGLGTLVVK